jgi:hypothetical protein
MCRYCSVTWARFPSCLCWIWYSLALFLVSTPSLAAAQLVVCTSSTSAVNFGVYNLSSSVSTDVAGNVQVRCNALSITS